MKLLHAMINVVDIDKSIKFYTEVFGMKLLSKKDYPGGRFTLAFVGYGDDSDNTVIELTNNWDEKEYELGNAFGHLAFGVNDIHTTCEEMRQKGVDVFREPGPIKHTSGRTIIALVRDPDGYTIELIEQSVASN